MRDALSTIGSGTISGKVLARAASKRASVESAVSATFELMHSVSLFVAMSGHPLALPTSRSLLVTNGLRSYGVAHREILPELKHRTGRYLNNCAENSHRPTRRRERQMQRFKSPQQAQRFLSPHALIYGHFRSRRHLMTAAQYQRARAEAFRVWRQETCVQVAA